ncbi:MAG: hypothetical protein P4L34_06660 [Paludibacter sp.]|nr:hypothetical protein [Paludibacter sp.]
MKNFTLSLLIFAGFLTSCVGGQLNSAYIYEKNPQYSWGYAEFYGAYYGNYGNKNNVLSVSLFTDSLKVNGIGSLVGIGQYLFLQDIFVSPTDTLLPVGTYIVSNSGLPFTVAPGKNDTVDSQIYPIGAEISYYEENAARSTTKLISSGSFIVSRLGSVYNIYCNFKTSDSLELNGQFIAELPHYDQSIATTKSTIRRKLEFALKKFN